MKTVAVRFHFVLKDLQKKESRYTSEGWAALAARGEARARKSQMPKEPMEVLAGQWAMGQWGGPACRQDITLIVIEMPTGSYLMLNRKLKGLIPPITVLDWTSLSTLIGQM